MPLNTYLPETLHLVAEGSLRRTLDTYHGLSLALSDSPSLDGERALIREAMGAIEGELARRTSDEALPADGAGPHQAIP